MSAESTRAKTHGFHAGQKQAAQHGPSDTKRPQEALLNTRGVPIFPSYARVCSVVKSTQVLRCSGEITFSVSYGRRITPFVYGLLFEGIIKGLERGWRGGGVGGGRGACCPGYSSSDGGSCA